MKLTKTDISEIADMLRELAAIKKDITQGNTSWEYSKILTLMSEYMCSDDEIVVDANCEVVRYEHR